ncbi:MAG: energy-coupling factor transporter ATPase, partial [Coriobacteriia bacterium]|nr:energy-coupling factor transporter ATPase [Coriobacteriia bacterium]
GTTIVMISHAMDEIAEVADSILLMSRGEGIAFGSNSEIFSQQELLEKHGLALPEASKYYFELQKRGVDLGDFIYTKDALVKAIRAYKDKKDKNHGV